MRQSPEPSGVTRTLALERAGRLSDVAATLTLRVEEDASSIPAGSVVLTFVLGEADAPLLLDFSPDHRVSPAVAVNGHSCDVEVVNGHVLLPGTLLRTGENVVAISFVAGTAGLHRATDLVYSLFVPARASLVFPCFDQPDIRVRWTVVLDVPSSWRATSNAREQTCVTANGRSRVAFAETPPLPTYLLAFACGRFLIDVSKDAHPPLRIFYRHGDADALAANRVAIVDRHRAAVRWLEAWTGIDYPFDSFDVVLLPSFQFGGMEHPGAIYYRADLLLSGADATPAEQLARDHVIAHETAHIWFGDLVTIRWFDDVWLKEVMANLLAARIVAEWYPDEPHDLRFLVDHFPAAYDVDRTAGARAIRQPLDNLADAGSLYGPIVYLKSPIAFRELERAMGAEAFRAAMRAFLDRHRYSSADWPDVMACLGEETSLDLRAWSRRWIETPGRPTLHLTHDATDDVRSVRLPGNGLAYGEVILDPALQDLLERDLESIASPVHRAAACLVLWDAMLARRLAPDRLRDAVLRVLAVETEPSICHLLLNHLRHLSWRFIPEAEWLTQAARIESVHAAGITRAGQRSEQAMWFWALTSLALTGQTVDRLHSVWARRRAGRDADLSPDDETRLALELALRLPDQAGAMLETQCDRLADPERRARLEFLTPAVAPDADARAAFAASLAAPDRRRRESWVLDAQRLIHHPLRQQASVALVVPALSLTLEIQRTGDIFFPRRWIDATLGGHQSPVVADIVRKFIDGLAADYPPRLRDALLVAADPLFRAARWLAG